MPEQSIFEGFPYPPEDVSVHALDRLAGKDRRHLASLRRLACFVPGGMTRYLLDYQAYHGLDTWWAPVIRVLARDPHNVMALEVALRGLPAPGRRRRRC
jgi:hypothetical protein